MRRRRVPTGAAFSRRESFQQELAHDRDLIGVHQRWRVSDAADLHQLRLRAATRHFAGGIASQKVGRLAAQEKRRAAHRVVKSPELEVFLRYEARLADARIV